jgi:uncharacterized protein (TIGR03067 family)
VKKARGNGASFLPTIDTRGSVDHNESRFDDARMEISMNLRRPILVMPLAGLLTAAAIARGDEPVTAKQIIGSWTCTSATIDGRPLGEEMVKQLRLTLTADRYKSQRGDQVLFDSTYTVDTKKNPATIDMIGTEGELKGKSAPGIFKLDGDMLTMCYVMPGKERPTAFESQPQSGAFLVVWKRAEK